MHWFCYESFSFVDYMQLKLLEIKENLDHLKCQSALTPCTEKWAVVHGYSGQDQHLKTGAIKNCSLFLKSWTKVSHFTKTVSFGLNHWSSGLKLVKIIHLFSTEDFYNNLKDTTETLEVKTPTPLWRMGHNIAVGCFWEGEIFSIKQAQSVCVYLDLWLATRDFKSPWNDQQNACCFSIFLCFP